MVNAVTYFSPNAAKSLALNAEGQGQRGVNAAQQGLGLLGKSRNAGNNGTSQVDNGSLNQVQDDSNGATEERVGNDTVGAKKSVDELSVGTDKLLRDS